MERIKRLGGHQDKRRFRVFTRGALLLFLLGAAVTLAACSGGAGALGRGNGTANADAADGPLGKMQLRKLPMTEETREILSLVDTHASSAVYEYQMDDSMKELHFFVEELKDGKLTQLAAAGGPAPASGTFAVMFDPDEITLSWDGAKYSCLIDTTAGYRSSVSSQLEGVSPLTYNEKEAVAMTACTLSDAIENADVTDYHDLLSLSQRSYDRVLFVTVVFTDFTEKDGLVSYLGKVRDQSQLSADTVRWLEHYNKQDLFSQLSYSSLPAEFLDLESEAAVLETPADK